jgi:hypothetical protein
MKSTLWRPLPLLLVALPLLASACSDARPTLRQQGIDGPPVITTDAANPDAPGACLASDSCEDGNVCTENRCVDGTCVAIDIPAGECCDPEELSAEGFDAGAAGVILHALNAGAGWHVLDRRSVSPPNALYFGNPDTALYQAATRVAGSATLPALDLPSDRTPQLTLRVLALIEPNPAYDKFWIEVDTLDDTGAVTGTGTVLTKGELPVGAYSDFALVKVDLDGLEGQRVQVRLHFDTLDEHNNAFEGMWIDDVTVGAACPILAACADDVGCDDGDACTADACSPEGCVYEPLCPDVSGLEGPCDAPDAAADCCTGDADCEDGDGATIDLCEGALCTVTMNPDACASAADCDDGEACTAETCVAGVCEYAGAFGEGCCVPASNTLATFDNGKLNGMYVTDNLERGVFWNVDKTRASSGDYSLYCGDPLAQSYDIGERVKASATTRVLEIPKGGTTTLSFDVYKATRPHRDYDVFQLLALRKGALFPLWSSKSLPDGSTAGRWQHVEVPLDIYAGQELQVRFVFDSVDAPPAAFEGVYFDTVQLETVCQ